MDFEKRLEEVARDAMLPIGQRLLGLDIENDQEQHDGAAILADAFRPLLSDLEARALSARAEALEEEERTMLDRAVDATLAFIDEHGVDAATEKIQAATRALAQTQPPDVSKEI